MENIFLELNKFNDIFFEEETHRYTDSLGTNYQSATGWIHQFAPETDWDTIAAKKAAKEGTTPEALRAEWDYRGKYACALGTECHAVMEYLWKRKNYNGNMNIMKQYEGMPEEFIGRKEMCKKLYDKMKNRYVPIANEFIVNDPEFGLCGTIDFIAYNQMTGKYGILDWKTSKSFDTSNSWGKKMLAPFDDLDDCNVVHYSLQLSLYKYILEKYTNIRIGELTLFALPKNGFPLLAQPCLDLSSRIKQFLENK